MFLLCCHSDVLVIAVHALPRTRPKFATCRSLMAAYELASSGYKKVSILQGGFYEWERNGRWACQRVCVTGNTVAGTLAGSCCNECMLICPVMQAIR